MTDIPYDLLRMTVGVHVCRGCGQMFTLPGVGSLMITACPKCARGLGMGTIMDNATLVSADEVDAMIMAVP